MMLVELVQIKRSRGRLSLNKIYLNPSHIVFISENSSLRSSVNEVKELGLVPQTIFSTIRLNDNGTYSEIEVVGEPSMIESKIFKKKKQNILRS